MYASPLLKDICAIKPPSVTQATLLRDALSLMAHTNYVVVTKNKRPVGLLREQDVLSAFAQARNPDATRVREVMLSSPIVVPQHLALLEAYHLCHQTNTRHVIVVDEAGCLYGVATDAEFMKVLGLDIFAHQEKIAQAMRYRQGALDKTSTLNDAVNLIVKLNSPAIVIVDEDSPIGLLTEQDLVRLCSTVADSHLPLTEVALSPVVSVALDASIYLAVAQMQGKAMHALAVVNAQGKFEGILTEHDVVKKIESRYLHTFNSMAQKQHHASEQLRMTHQLEQAASMFENTAVGIMITDAQANIMMVNAAFTHITGYSEAEVRGKNPRLLSAGKHDQAFYSSMWESLNTKGFWQGELWNRRKNGEAFAEWLTINVVRDTQQQIKSYIAVFADITSARLAHDKFEYLAHHDYLTKLPNRLLFNARLTHSLARTKRTGDALAILMIDLDGFKDINDQYGHLLGDKLLEMVAERLIASVRLEDTVARLGGDEFVIVLENVSETTAAVEIAYKLIRTIAAPITLAQHTVRITASIGVALSSSIGNNPELLISRADEALYKAKDAGKNTVVCASAQPDSYLTTVDTHA